MLVPVALDVPVLTVLAVAVALTFPLGAIFHTLCPNFTKALPTFFNRLPLKVFPFAP
jgi:hypothetical protein